MNVKEFLDKIGVSQEDFAVFTGIPRPRIAAWIKYRKDTPPKVEDANIYQLAVRNLSELQQEDAQNMVKNYRIFLNNIISKSEYDNLIKSGIPAGQQTDQLNEPEAKYGSQDTYTQQSIDNPMLQMFVEMQKQSTEGMRDLSAAFKDVAQANLIMARLLEKRYMDVEEMEKKEKAG